MNSEILISIIVPCYNVEKYLPKCVNSILSQTYKNLEILLVDDGSPDRCGKICDEYAKIDNRIKVIHKPNGGLSDARNVAIDIATGAYLTFVDSDDFVTDDYIITLLELIRKYQVDIAISNLIYSYNGAKINVVDKNANDFVLDSKKAVEKLFYQQGFDTCAYAKIYKRELFGDGIRYPKGFLYEDLLTTYKLILKTKRVAFTTRRTYFYLMRANGILGNSFSPKKNDILKIGDMLLSDFKLNNPQLLPALYCRLLSCHFNVFLQMDIGNYFEQLYWSKLKAWRWIVLKDKKARMKARIAALISYMGIKPIRFFFRLIYREKSM